MPSPLVAIVGAPNVGKSTLFNRLVGGRRAIVTDEPGVTRDRIYGEVTDVARPFRVVDTGGLAPGTDAPYADGIERQAETAMAEAAVLVYVVDARAGVTALDRELAARLRRRGLPIVLVANKVDSPKTEPLALELYELGLGEPVQISAEHARGIDRLLERVDELLVGRSETPPDAGETAVEPLALAIVGRPNVGKSSLMNRIAGEERALVSEVPGTTRDAVDTLVQLGERRYLLIDTAGIRRPGKLRQRAERFSVARARRNIERCDVAVLVLDATLPLSAQDAHIAGHVREAIKPLLVAVNKWDRIREREREAKRWEEQIRQRLRFVKEAPIVWVSAKSGQRVSKILDRADALHAAAGIEVPTAELNRWLQEVAAPVIQSPARGGALRVYYATQTGTHPPRFLVFCNDPRRAHFSFRRFLDNALRERFGFGGAPLRLQFRARRARVSRG